MNYVIMFCLLFCLDSVLLHVYIIQMYNILPKECTNKNSINPKYYAPLIPKWNNYSWYQFVLHAQSMTGILLILAKQETTYLALWNWA